MIDGTAGPVRGPVDITIENNRITKISAGYQGLTQYRPPAKAESGEFEIDGRGLFVMPGLIDDHVHGEVYGAPLTFSYKLWLAHGVTTVRGVPLLSGPRAGIEKRRSENNEIVAPRIVNYQVFGQDTPWPGGAIDSTEKAREFVRWAASQKVDGIKFFGHGPGRFSDILAAALDEAKKHRLGTTMHMSEVMYPDMSGLEAGSNGLGTITHLYGHGESLLKNRIVYPYKPTVVFENEQESLRAIVDLTNYTYEPGSEQWWAYLREQKANGVAFSPTLTMYVPYLDLAAARTREWHAQYSLPSSWKAWTPGSYGSGYYDWTSVDEAATEKYLDWMGRLLHDYHAMGGRVLVGSDSGFSLANYGFGTIQEMELLQQFAGLTSAEVIRAATLDAARTLTAPLGKEPDFGWIREGNFADLVVLSENPLLNLKILYGTGFARLDKNQKVERVNGIKYVIRNGIIYDPHMLLADVRRMVDDAKAGNGCADVQPAWSRSGPCSSAVASGSSPVSK